MSIVSLPDLATFTSLKYFRMTSLNDILIAAPKLEAQLILAFMYTILWYILINHVFVPIGNSFIAKLKSKKRFIHFNRESFKNTIKWDIGDDEEEQIIAISRIDAAMVQHLIGGLLLIPSAFRLGHFLPAGADRALASHGGLSEMGWEIQDLVFRTAEIIFGGERGLKLNPPSLMLTLLAHHSAACSAVIPMNMFYPNGMNGVWHEGFCIVQLGSFILLFMQQYGYTLDVQTKDGLKKMKIAISISFFTCLWTRVVRYFWILKLLHDGFSVDGSLRLIQVGFLPSMLLSVFNLVVMRDAAQKFMKFVSMDIKKLKTHSQRNIQETIKKLGSIKDLPSKSTLNHSYLRSSKLYTGVSAEDIFGDY